MSTETSKNLSGLKAADFQKLVQGKRTDLYILTNAKGYEVAATNYAGAIVAIMVPDRDGKIANVIHGHDNIDDVISSPEPFLSTLIGRYGNRICKGKFTLDGKEYNLAINNGPNALHGGPTGFHARVWDAQQLAPNKLRLHYTAEDMEEGFPGRLEMTVDYTWTDDCELVIDYRGTTDKKTIAAQEDGLVKLAVARNTGSESRSASVKAVLTDGTPLADITVNQSWRNVEPGELLIEEVYFSGSPLEGSDRSSDDQYIRLTNNADHTIYADRVMFVTNFITGTITSAGAYYEYPDVEDGIVVEDMYVIPGSGDEYPLEPGASLILAISAENYQENNPAAFDLSKADFEFYGSDNDYFPDTDNPDVPNLENWFKSSFSYFSLHNRGYESYAIVYAPLSETAESIMGDHHWSGTYYMHFNEWEFTYDINEEDAWLIPGEWVLDAVNCCTEDSFYRNPWGPAFDAGWTHAGDYDGDPSRFGKSVRRAVDDNGKLVDTNNSTNDFIPNATPTLR